MERERVTFRGAATIDTFAWLRFWWALAFALALFDILLWRA
jgi:hypothetical protein